MIQRGAFARAAALIGLCVAASVGRPTMAQTASTPDNSSGALQEVVVTAERQEESLQKTPMNVTVVTGQNIAEQGMQDMQDVLNGLPGVTVQGQVRGFVPSIRGLGTDLPPGSGQGSVATEEDGAYDIRAEVGRVGYYDLQRVEVLAGPQGTLYGVNSDGGVVNIISNDPVLGKFNASGGLTIGNYSLAREEGMLNIPMGDTLSLRLAAANIHRAGYLTNTGADDDVGRGERAKLLWKPSEAFSLLLGFEYAQLGGKGSGSVANYPNGDAPSAPWTDNSAGTGSSDINQADHYHSDKYWGAMKWNVGIGTLSFTPSYKSDYDWQNSCGMGPSCTLQGDPLALEQNSEELRLSSNPGGALSWAFGLYHFGYLEKESGMGPGNPPPVTYYQTSNGVFGQGTYAVSDVFRLIGGLRETKDWKKETDLNSGPGNWSHVDYRAGLEYDATPSSMEYLTLASGYRPGGFNFDGSTYKTEVLRDIEIGSKNRFLNNTLQVNADVYYYDFSNYQLLDFYFAGPCNALAPPPPTYNLSARDIGLDLAVAYQLSTDDSVNLSLSYVNNKFTSSQVIAYDAVNSCPPGFNGNAIVDSYTINGSPEPRSPKLSGSAGYEHRFRFPDDSYLSVQPSVHFSEAYYINPVENIYSYQPGFATYDANATYHGRGDHWTIALWGRNLSNEPIKTQLNPGLINEPRTYGVTITARLN